MQVLVWFQINCQLLLFQLWMQLEGSSPMEAAILRNHPAVLGSIPKHIYTFFNLKCDEKKEEINKTRPE